MGSHGYAVTTDANDNGIRARIERDDGLVVYSTRWRGDDGSAEWEAWELMRKRERAIPTPTPSAAKAEGEG